MGVLTAKDFNPAVEVELPSMAGSGNVVLLRLPDLLALVDSDGDVADPLTNILLSSLNGKGGSGETKLEYTRENLPTFIAMLDRICMATFVSPKLTLGEGDDEHVSVRHVSFNDKVFIMQWAMGGGDFRKVERFRPQSGGNVETVPKGKVVPVRPRKRNGN